MKRMGAWIKDPQNAEVSFRVFAFDKPEISLVVQSKDRVELFPMTEERPHVYTATVTGLGLDLLYKFRLANDKNFPDPYSHFQPFGVHEFSQVVNHQTYTWHDQSWPGRDLEEMVIYELHVGTFTAEGTFRAAAAKLDYLLELGVNTLELMPLAQTPGRWNWGYDGVFLFSVNHNYGTPDDLKYLIDQCHQKGLAVLLDVVYNHLGPEGNYLPEFGPYFTYKHETPWGAAVNYDDAFCEFTRQMVLDNVTHWIENYHFDGLRLDAVHAILDDSELHILQEISQTVKKLAAQQGRRLVVIAETDENNVKLINPIDQGGYGIDAQWMDDFHHCIHTVLTGELDGYYLDYGRIKDFEKVFKNYLYTGEYSRFLKKNRGSDASANPGKQFVVATQNHDQVGNRAQGERLSQLVEFPYLKAAAGLVLISPYLPLIFMGEEYAEKNPFQFFTDFTDPDLKDAVVKGRQKEFQRFSWGKAPNPQDPATFYRSKLTPRTEWDDQNKFMFAFYRDLLALRRTHPVLRVLDKFNLEVQVQEELRLITVRRWRENRELIALFNLGQENRPLPYPGAHLLNSEWPIYGGSVEGESQILTPGNLIILESPRG
jgi:maltooligosyltrehalose trehalohydrolase